MWTRISLPAASCRTLTRFVGAWATTAVPRVRSIIDARHVELANAKHARASCANASGPDSSHPKTSRKSPAPARNLDAPFPVSPSGGKPGRAGSPHAGARCAASQRRCRLPPQEGLPPPCASPAQRAGAGFMYCRDSAGLKRRIDFGRSCLHRALDTTSRFCNSPVRKVPVPYIGLTLGPRSPLPKINPAPPSPIAPTTSHSAPPIAARSPRPPMLP